MNLKRKGVIVPAVATAAILMTAAVGFACTNLATLNLSAPQGRAGDVVTVTGSSFSTKTPVADVVLRWNGVDGAELARVQPDKAGNISATFTVPESQPGYYVLVATQKDERGVDTYGTPARASYLVLGPNGQNVTPPATAPAAIVVSPESGSGGIIALTVGLGVLGLTLFGAGFTAFLRQARRTPEAATVRRS